MQVTRQAIAFLDDGQFPQLLLSRLQFLHQLLITIPLPFHLLDCITEETTNNKRNRIEQNGIETFRAARHQRDQTHDAKTECNPQHGNSGA
jgi:hypothetical protein